MNQGTESRAAVPGRSPELDAAQLEVLRRYGTERDVAAGEVLFADGDETYDLIVVLDGTAEIIQGYGRPGATIIAGYSRSQILGEIGMLTVQRAYLTAVATSAGRVLAVPVAQLRVVMAHEPGLSDLILRTFLLRHSILMRRGAGLTLIGSRFDPDTRRPARPRRAPGRTASPRPVRLHRGQAQDRLAGRPARRRQPRVPAHRYRHSRVRARRRNHDSAVPGDQQAGDLRRRRRPQRLGQARRGRHRRRLDGGAAGLRPPPGGRQRRPDRARHRLMIDNPRPGCRARASTGAAVALEARGWW